MTKLKEYIFVVVLIFWIKFVSSFEQNHRSRRFLLFPRAAPTRIQIITGIGIPVELDLEAVTIGYVFKTNFFLPYNTTQVLDHVADPFEVVPTPISAFDRKRRSNYDESTEIATEIAKNDIEEHRGYDSEHNEGYESHTATAEVVESGTEPNDSSEMNDEMEYDETDDPMAPKTPQNLGTLRWTAYKGMAAMAESKGHAGKACVLRSICEAAHTPFDYSNGILGELMYFVMSPSSTHDQLSDYSDSEYYRAENMGKEGAPCERVFKECGLSLLEQFSGIYSPIDLLKKFTN